MVLVILFSSSTLYHQYKLFGFGLGHHWRHDSHDPQGEGRVTNYFQKNTFSILIFRVRVLNS